MLVLVLILLLLAAVFGVLGAVLKAVAFLVITAVLTVMLAALAWWFQADRPASSGEYDRQITEQRVTRYRVNEAQHDPEHLPPHDDRY